MEENISGMSAALVPFPPQKKVMVFFIDSSIWIPGISYAHWDKFELGVIIPFFTVVQINKQYCLGFGW